MRLSLRLPLRIAAPVQPPKADAAAVTSAQMDLERAVLPTDIPRWLAIAVAGAFMFGIVAVPVVQVWREATGRSKAQLGDLFRQVPTRDSLQQYEDAVARNAVVKKRTQPRIQQLLTAYAGVGTSNVVAGRDGWLFYRPGVNMLAGRGLIDPTRLRLRAKQVSAAGERVAHPDPRPAILAFRDACAAAGAHLVVVPVPDKAAVQPGELTGRLAAAAPPPANAGYPQLLAELRAAGVDVFDPTPATVGPGERPRFLVTDTHWTPDWMGEVAERLAAHIRPRLPAGSRAFRTEDVSVRRVGDLVDMLELPPDQTVFPPQEATVHRVVDAATGAAWEPSPTADVVLLGDSFTNIFTAKDMGWGEAAGFGPQLACRLGRDVDVVAMNGSGATGTRREFARRGGPAGKKVVVWQFAARELYEGSWDVVPMPAAGRPAAASAGDGPLVVDGTLEAISKVPAPFSSAYGDCLTYAKVRLGRVIEGTYADTHIVVVLWGMKNNVHLPAAGYQPGRPLKLRLVPFSKAGLKMDAIRRVDDLDDFEHRPYYVTEEIGS